MAHPSQNPRRYIHFDDPDDESEISSIAFQLAAASAAGQQRHGGAPTQTQTPGHSSHLSYPGHYRHHLHPHQNHPAVLSTLVASPGLVPAGYFHPPTLNSSLASAIVAAEFQRQREATSAAQFATVRMSGTQPYVMGFSNYAHHAPPPSSAIAYHQQPPQAFSGMEALVGGVSPLRPESSLSAVAHSETSTQVTSSSATPSSNPVTATLISTTAAATLPAVAASAADDRTTATASNPSTLNLTSANKTDNDAGSHPHVSAIVPNRPLLPTPKWFGASTSLGVDEDKYYLSELQCVLRREFVEVFGTTQVRFAFSSYMRMK